MARHTLSLTLAALLIPAVAGAHVGVRPRESKPGAEERYTVRVPTEGAVSTFVARNPAAGTEIVWKAHQRFADRTASDWVESAGSKRPAPVTRLTNTTSAATSTAGNNAQATLAADAAAVDKWLAGYDAAFLSKDLDKIAVFYHPDVTIYEGSGINDGWIDYRDKHLGPELKAFEGLEFGHSDRKVTVAPDGRTAYATSRYFIKAKMGDRALDSVGLETLVLMKQADGTWKIRHSHTSSRARRPTDK